jgi:hypothetical protein
MFPRYRFSLMLLTLVAAPATALADEGRFFGPLRSRDLTPFGFVRLDMRPAHAVSIEPGSWAIEAELGYQNTWALSEQVEDYLVSLEPSGRSRLGPDEVAAIRALPGENYLLDLEQALVDVTIHYKFAEHWAAYTTLGVLSFQGGFLDSSIEGFHDTFGFSTFGRPALERDSINVIYDLEGAQVEYLGDVPTDGGLTDPVFGVRYAGLQFSPSWHLTLEAAVKLPLQGRRPLVSSGRTDFGLQASLQWLGRRNAFHASASAVYYAGVAAPTSQDRQIIPTVVLGYEFRLTANTNLNVQAYLSESVYTRNQTSLDELISNKYQYSLGLRHRIGKAVLTFALNENLQNVNNTPDVGFQFGFAYVPF